MRTLSEIISEIKRLKGIKNDNEVADVLKMEPKTLATAKARNSYPYEELILFCRREGVPIDLIFFPEERQLENKDGSLIAHDVVYGDEFVSIPLIRGPGGLGEGRIADNTIDMRVAFRRDWIRRKGEARNMALTPVTGDSMEPTLKSGDLVLYDRSLNFIDPQGGLYAITLDQNEMVKRLQVLFPAKKIKIISDNPRYESIEVKEDQFRISGKVIWFARELER